MKKKLLFYLLLVAQTSLIFSQSFSSNFRKIGTEEGLSQVRVNTLLEDSQGFIWAGTVDGLNRYDGNEFKVFKSNLKDTTTLSNNLINDLEEDKDGNIWAATIGGGICKYNPVTEQFKRYMLQPADTTQISDNVVYKIHIDDENRIWAGHRKGLDLYNKETDTFEAVAETIKSKTANSVFDITDTKNTLWLATASGLKKLNTQTQKIEKVYKNNPQDANSLSLNQVIRVTKGSNGLLWIMLPGYNMNSVNPKTHQVIRYFKDPGKNPHPRSIYHSNDGKIWLATEIQGLVMFDPEKDAVKPLPTKSILKNNQSNIRANTILEDKTGSFWVGTMGHGILHYSIGANTFMYEPNFFDSPYDSRTDSFRNSFEDKDGFLWFSSDQKGIFRLNPNTGETQTFEALKAYLKVSKVRVNDIHQDIEGNIWLATRNTGLIKLNPQTNNFKVYFDKLGSNNKVGTNSFHLIVEDHKGILWLASVGFLTGFNPKTEETVVYAYNPSKPDALPGNLVSAIYEDLNQNLLIGFFTKGLHKLNRKSGKFIKIPYEKGENIGSGGISVANLYQKNRQDLWIGTNQGLFKYNTQNKTTIQYSTETGLANNMIYHVLEDESGNLWLSTNDGISKFNPEEETFKNYNAEDGLFQSEFNIVSGHRSPTNGLIYFGGTKGFNYFDPNDIKTNTNIAPVKFTEFKKYNSKGEITYVKGVNLKDKIKLAYDERDFSVKVVALDYTNPSKNQYAYWLEGYNDNWIETGTKRDINFTNLSPGNYTLKVKGANNDGVWNEQGKTLQISILPPWWGTWWAYTLYALALLALMYAAYSYRINQLETVRLKELDETKRTMYTNITHEFRTPLTVISGINKEIKEKSEGKFQDQFDLIERNSKNMLYLVNQLLELRKLEVGKTEMNYIQGDLIAYLKYLAESFNTFAKTKDIELHFVSISEKIIMDYDPDKLLMIMSNLLSNAIKYSEPETDVYLQVEELKDKVNIRVVDSGKGIPEEKLPHIFDRFYKVQNKSEDNVDGVGIGLAVTKELVQLLEGEITVASKLDKGSIFSLTLPIVNNAPLVETPLPITDNVTKTETGIKSKQKEANLLISEDAQNLLIIEDNKDIVQYLKSCLEQNWNLTLANDGKIGIEKAIENVPDIILCDLMMPNANGYQVLENLKNNPTTSHIPIVILTAKADEESRLEAYRKGADAYLLKPFNKDELEIILQKLTEQRRLLQERYKAQNSLRFAEGVEIRKEDTFMQQLEELVLSENIKKSYSITDLCEDLGMSRTQLHNKIKALTGKSTSIFVRSLRLQKGKYLLEHTNQGISEIAYNVGFNNPSYFTKSFTEEFGIAPSSLRK